MVASVKSILSRLSSAADRASWLGPLLARLTLAAVFAPSGWGKLHNLEKITAFFTELHIPAPQVNAVVASSTEFFGGLLLLVGLGTRLVSLPLAFTMVVAIFTAKRPEIDGISTLLAFNEFTYFAMLVWLALVGPGSASIDRLIGWSGQGRTSKGALQPRATTVGSR
jgi:putative oxidoreductase